MPELSFNGVFLGLEMNFRLGVADEADEPMTARLPVEEDASEAALSPAARRMQRGAREKAKRRELDEREADWESLDILEIATAAASEEAKINDQQSLDMLIRCTQNFQRTCTLLATPTRTTFFPPARHFQGMGGTPLSFEPPFSTPSDVRRVYEPDSTGNEFGDFLAKESAKYARAHASLEQKKKRRRNSFSALLESAKTSKGPTAAETEGNAYEKNQLASFSDLVKKVENKDYQDELALTRELVGAGESPTASPTSSIKHRRMKGGRGNSNEERDEGEFDENDFIDFWLAGGSPLPADDENSEDDDDATAVDDGDVSTCAGSREDGNEDSDEEDWEVV